MISLLFSVLLLAETPATDAAAASTATTTVPATVPAPKEPRKICKRDVVSTSLHGSKRICMTRLEWKARELNASVEDMGGVTTK